MGTFDHLLVIDEDTDPEMSYHCTRVTQQGACRVHTSPGLPSGPELMLPSANLLSDCTLSARVQRSHETAFLKVTLSFRNRATSHQLIAGVNLKFYGHQFCLTWEGTYIQYEFIINEIILKLMT